MGFFSRSGSHDFIPFRLGKEMSGQPTQEIPEDMETNPPPATPQATVTEAPLFGDLGAMASRSSGSDSESCGDYFTRKMEPLGAAETSAQDSEVELDEQEKASVSDAVATTPGLNLLFQQTENLESAPLIRFLDSSGTNPDNSGAGSEGSSDVNFPNSSLTVGTQNAASSTSGQEAVSVSEPIGAENFSVDRGQMDYRSNTDDDSRFDMEIEAGSQARSTLAEALRSAKSTKIVCPVGSSNESSDHIAPVEPGPTALSGTSRAIIKQCFSEVNATFLDPGHPVVVFNQDPITSILRIVADESARASFEMLKSVVERASRLNISGNKPSSSRTRARTPSGLESDTDAGSVSVTTYGLTGGETSPGLTTDTESRQDFQSSVKMPSPPVFADQEPFDPESNQGSPFGSSPGTQTLAAVRKEAIKEKRQSGKGKSAKSRARGPPRPKRRVRRIMREEHFDSMPWTRVFVSGPVDPKWNPHKIFCQICKCNVSIRSKGPR